MLSLKNESEICRIGLITGLFMKKDVISWADKIIEINDNIEYDIIEISLLGNSRDADITLRLSEIKGIVNNQLVLNVFLGLCLKIYNSDRLDAEQISTVLYNLISKKIEIALNCEEIEGDIHRLADGYSLAAEGVYGDLKDICIELKEFLDQYNIYAEDFSVIY